MDASLIPPATTDFQQGSQPSHQAVVSPDAPLQTGQELSTPFGQMLVRSQPVEMSFMESMDGPSNDNLSAAELPVVDESLSPPAPLPNKTTSSKSGSDKKARALDAMLVEAPGLAFMMGRLEFVSPKDIPAVVAETPFIQEALSHGDVHKLMLTPRPLGQIIDSLKLPPVIKSQLAKRGVDLSQLVAPKDFMRQLGVDAGIVSSELQMLRDNLPLDGLNRYMVRATKLNQAHPQAVTNVPNQNREVMDSLRPTTPKPVERPQALPLTSPAAPASAPTPTEAPQVVMQTPVQNQGNSNGSRPGHFNRASAESPKVDSYAEQPVAFERVQRDPTLGVQNKLQAAEPLPSLPTKLETLSLDRASVKRSPMDYAGLLRVESKGMPNEAIIHEASPVALQNRRFDTQQNVDRLMASQSQGEPIVASVAPVREPNFNSQGESHQQNGAENGFEFRGIPALKLASHPVDPEVRPVKFKDQLFQADQLPAVRHAVVEKAQILVEEGGGKILLDVGKGPQKVELAMNVDNDTVNLKILTGSDQLKDLIAGDLPKLREALHSQNLNLKEVELGTNVEHQFGNQRQQNHDFSNGEQTRTFDPVGKQTDSGLIRKAGQVVNHFKRVPHRGQIQVLA